MNRNSKYVGWVEVTKPNSLFEIMCWVSLLFNPTYFFYDSHLTVNSQQSTVNSQQSFLS